MTFFNATLDGDFHPHQFYISQAPRRSWHPQPTPEADRRQRRQKILFWVIGIPAGIAWGCLAAWIASIT